MVSHKLMHKVARQARKQGRLIGSDIGPFQTIVDSNPVSVIAESFRTVLNAVLMSQALPPRVIVITSAVMQEGKTSMSINLAIARARQGKRVLLVDGDLRKPTISRILGLPDTVGLSTVLATGRNGAGPRSALGASAEVAIVPVPGVPNLFALPAGVTNPEKPEIVTAEAMRALITRWREHFDLIVVDTPPVLLVADAVQLAIEADAVLLVVRSGYTTQDAFGRAQQLLYQVNAPLRGVLLNGVDFRSPDLHYVHEYGYADTTVN
jgi:capsular exopolysaccharide synthesis family protein